VYHQWTDYSQVEQVVSMLNVVYYDEHDLSFQLDAETMMMMMMMMIQELELMIVEIKRQQYQLVLAVVVKQLFQSI